QPEPPHENIRHQKSTQGSGVKSAGRTRGCAGRVRGLRLKYWRLRPRVRGFAEVLGAARGHALGAEFVLRVLFPPYFECSSLVFTPVLRALSPPYFPRFSPRTLRVFLGRL